MALDFPGLSTCGATKRDGGVCSAPAMPNGRCRIHGGKSTGPNNPYVTHGLYRRRLDEEERQVYDALVADPHYDDMTKEIAMLRIMIDRCLRAIMEGEEWRVPLQTMPLYIDKLLKLITRMRPQQANLVLTDQLDKELEELLNEERAAALLKHQDDHPSDRD